MIRRWQFYLRLGWLDLVRLWPTTRHHAIIVAGICLPILMLLGIKRGHVAELRRDLVTSPIGRQVTFWSARKGELMDRTAVARLSDDLPSVEVIIPETQRVVRMSRSAHPSSASSSIDESGVSATIYATRPGDPLLAQLGIKAPASGERLIVLGEGLAKRLEVGVGEQVELHLTRGRDDQEERVSLTCNVLAVMPTEQQDASIGYLDLDLLDACEQFVRGQRVESLNWPSARTQARDGYSSYLIFCERGNDLTDDDRKFLADRGFLLTDRTAEPPAPLDRLLAPQSRAELRIYEVATTQSSQRPEPRLFIAPSELSEQTAADDVVLPWNPPATAESEGCQWTLVGLSLPRRTWLREYFVQADLPFDYDAEPFQSRTLEPIDPITLICTLNATQRLAIPCTRQLIAAAETLAPTDEFQLEASTPSETTTESLAAVSALAPANVPANERMFPQRLPAVAIVPANLTAWLAAHRAGMAAYDATIQLFVPLPQPPVYDRARLYARTIDDVPAVVAALSSQQFAVMSETGRIAEIHRQDRSLQLLVWVVGVGVFLFGIVTVVSVLMDSTDRKRGTIGILRVMGVSPGGIFVSILLRSAMIGLLAAALSLACGWGLAVALEWQPATTALWLNWKPVVHIELHPWDMAIVGGGALLCCGLGSLPPAWRASRLDPFDAIVEGRFR